MTNNDRVVRSSCRGCHGVCQVLVHMDGEKIVRVSGDAGQPHQPWISLSQRGWPHPRCSTIRIDSNIPCVGPGRVAKTSGSGFPGTRPITEMADRFDCIRRESGTEYLAVAQGTGRPYTEFTIRFANAFGTPNFVNPGHLCYLPRVIASAITLGATSRERHLRFWWQEPGLHPQLGMQPSSKRVPLTACADPCSKGPSRKRRRSSSSTRGVSVLPKRADHWLQLRPGSECALASGNDPCHHSRRPL